MKKFKIITDNGTIHATTPSNWNEITVGQYTRFESCKWDGKDPVKLLSILSGVDLKELDNVTDNRLYSSVTAALSFVNSSPPDFEKLKRSKTFTIGGKQLPVPVDLELERFGQKSLMLNLLSSDDMIQQIPMAMAIYFQPIFDKSRFDRSRLPIVVDMVSRSPIIEAYPIVRFFFRKLTEYKLSGKVF